MARNYSNIALDTTLTAGINAAALTCVVTSAAGYPAAPFAIVIDPGLVTEEVCQVTVKAGTTFTITRAFDGTTAQIHALGATVRHAAIAGDFTDLQASDTAEASARAGADTTLQTNITSEAGTRAAADALLAPIASPTFTGVPAAPTAAPGTNTTQLATTAFVVAAAAAGYQPLDSDLTAIAALTTTAFGRSFLALADAAAARTLAASAPLSATYITQTANTELSAEQALSALATGYVKNTTGTGVLSSQAVPIPIADGGTNAITAGAALTSLGAAPLNATYLTQVAESGLSAEQALSSLATGYMKVTTGTGAVSSQAVPIPVADGGTGGTTAATARTALSAARSVWFDVRDYGATGNGVTSDTAAIAAAIAAVPSTGGLVYFPPGVYVANIAPTSKDDLTLMGAGDSSVITPASGTALAIADCDRIHVSDMRFTAGATGISIDGAIDSFFCRLSFTGQSTSGISIDGDDATEIHMRDIALRDVGGYAIDYLKTVASDTGGMYLSNVRAVRSSTGTTGVRIRATSGGVGPVYIWLTDVVCDNYADYALIADNVAHVYVKGGFFSSGVASKGAIYLNKGFAHKLVDVYAINTNASGYALQLAGSVSNSVIAAIIFDGATATAIDATGAGSNIRLMDYYSFCATLSTGRAALMSQTAQMEYAPMVVVTKGSGGAGEAFALMDSDAASTLVLIRNTGGTFQILKSDFSAEILSLTQAGALSWNSGAAITKHFYGTASWTPGLISDTRCVSLSFTVSGVAIGDTVNIGYSQALSDNAFIVGKVTAANTCVATIVNLTGGNYTPTAGNVLVDVWRH